MQQAGMNIWSLLQASTINGVRAINKQDELGSIKKGTQANLLLLSKNPLDSINNWKAIDWVINKGVAMKPDSAIKLSAGQFHCSLQEGFPSFCYLAAV
jgi:imidazolonepropionase-like amidohydrolase